MTDFTKLKINDIKQKIIDEKLLTQEELSNVNVKGKTEWVKLYKELNEDDSITMADFNDLEMLNDEELVLEPEIENTKTKETKEKTAPSYSDPEWHDYVMSHFDKEELVDGKYPNVNALRRVVELLLGEIIFSGPVDTKCTLSSEIGKAVVTYEIIIEWKLDCGPYINPLEDRDVFPQKVFRSVASSWIDNTDDVFSVFPESIAETRAEGRALRRALRLGVVCADELTQKNVSEFINKSNTSTTGEWDENDMITDQQINSINLLCNRLSIDVNKFINSGSKQYDDIKKVNRQSAADMIKRLNQYQSTGEGSKEIPEDLLIGD